MELWPSKGWSGATNASLFLKLRAGDFSDEVDADVAEQDVVL